MSQKNYFIHASSVVDEPVKIGDGTKIWHFFHISPFSPLFPPVPPRPPPPASVKAKIGNNVKIQNNVSVYDGVTLEDYVFCGPSMVFTNDINPRSKYSKDGKYQKTLIKEGASIGANVTIVTGITIGKHAFIGAGAVVTKNIPDYTLVYGSPAKGQGWICECGEKIIFRNNASHCNNCRRKYIKNKYKVTLSSKE